MIHDSAEGHGMVGSLLQEPYKGDLFKLFTAAYWGGMTERHHDRDSLTGDYLVEEVGRLCPSAKLDGSKENNLLWKVMGWWNEWRYAYNHYDKR
jgi:hypothetical protein